MLLTLVALAVTGPASLSGEEITRAIEAGRVEQAQAMIARALGEGADAQSLERPLADLDFALGNHRHAALRYAWLVDRTPGDGMLVERLGLAWLLAGDNARAAAALERAVSSGGGWRSWNGLGVIADRERRWNDAGQAYAKALAMAPNRAEVLNNIGWSHLLRGQMEHALDAFEKAAGASPGSALIAANLELARTAIAEDLPARRPGESEQSWAGRLNDAGVIAHYRRQPKRAKAAFSQAIEARGAYYERAANNLAAATGGK